MRPVRVPAPVRLGEGSVGAGTGATVAKLLGSDRCVKGGTGTASIDLGAGVVVGALMCVNALGGVRDPESGEMVAGPRDADGAMLDAMSLITSPGYDAAPDPSGLQHDYRRRRDQCGADQGAGKQARGDGA